MTYCNAISAHTFIRHCPALQCPVQQCPVRQCPVLQFQRSRQNICLVATHSARNLSFIFDEPMRYSFIKYQLFPNLVGLAFVIFALSVSTSILRRSVPSLLIVLSNLDYCNSLYYDLPTSQINHLQYIYNSFPVVSKPLNPVASPLLFELYKINERIE